MQRGSSWPVERAQQLVPKPGKKNSGRDEKTWDEETREKKHLQARAKTPYYREDSELHHGEGVVNEVFL